MKISAFLSMLLITLCMLPVVILTAIFSLYSDIRKNPPYHIVKETGDVIVYLFESSKWGGKYHEYPFVNTVNGLKYVISDEKQRFYKFLFLSFTIVLTVLLLFGSKDKLYFLLFLMIFSVFIVVLVTVILIECVNMHFAKDYLRDNNFSVK